MVRLVVPVLWRAGARCASEVVYLKELLKDFNITCGCVPIMEDNQACIQISKNPVHHQRTKHIAKFYHFVRDQCLSGDIELAGIGTDFQVADVFTKHQGEQGAG